jgi:hypothetical protein
MKTGFIIFNGIRVPYDVADSAIAWAEKNKAPLVALFLKGHEDEEGYIFPSDLDLAENLMDKDDAEKDDKGLIKGNIKLLQDMASSKGVTLQADQLDNPTMEQALDVLRDASIVFIDAKADPDDIAAPQQFNVKDLINRLTIPVEQV